MSRIYKQYIMLKIKNPNKYFLFKAGIFFIFIDEDAKHMSKILNLKIGNLNNEIVKCGFPENSLEKYMNILKNLNYDIAIIDTQNNLIYNFDNYNIDSKIKNIMDEIILFF